LSRGHSYCPVDNPLRFGYAQRMQFRIQLSSNTVFLICAIVVLFCLFMVRETTRSREAPPTTAQDAGR